jgi:hypothetical protein
MAGAGRRCMLKQAVPRSRGFRSSVERQPPHGFRRDCEHKADSALVVRVVMNDWRDPRLRLSLWSNHGVSWIARHVSWLVVFSREVHKFQVCVTNLWFLEWEWRPESSSCLLGFLSLICDFRSLFLLFFVLGCDMKFTKFELGSSHDSPGIAHQHLGDHLYKV